MMAAILLVEDEVSTVTLLTRALTKAGHRVVAAHDGAAGLAQAKSARPDLIVMDMGLPAMSGFEAIRSLKSDPTTRAIPLLALTAAVTAGDRDEAYEAGCDAYENKPVDLARFLARVAELLNR